MYYFIVSKVLRFFQGKEEIKYMFCKYYICNIIFYLNMLIWPVITLSNMVTTRHIYLFKLKLIKEIKLKIQFPNVTSHISSAGSHTDQ